MLPAEDIFRPALSLWRAVLRLPASVLPSVLVFMLWESSKIGFVAGPIPFLFGLVYFTLLSAIIAMLYGAPLYLLFRARNWTAWWIFALAGAIPPPLIFFLITNPAYLPPGTIASSGGCRTIDNGVMTACGWIEYRGVLVEFALFGALAGLAFWGLLRWRRRH